ncbi:unnamed protein product [Polarella glacialis]|uniref:Uncharacterized protein n=1 Tax=Polarella glacialis TaxID=89957 RepID=A0A813HE08_POLGL|nr:unnamed protein product [Polarella glacialis]CAE8653218.1 unnamed protein product [Polarella glacialis]
MADADAELGAQLEKLALKATSGDTSDDNNSTNNNNNSNSNSNSNNTIDGANFEAGPRHCKICQLSWTGSLESVAMHESGKTHHKRLLAPRGATPHAGDSAFGVTSSSSVAAEVADCKGQLPPPAWALLPATSAVGTRDPPAGTAAAMKLWPWPGDTPNAFDEVAKRFLHVLMQQGMSEEMQSRVQKAVHDQEPQSGSDDPSLTASGTQASHADRMESCAQKAFTMQSQMRRCTQQPEDFADIEALWGYAEAKFSLRAGMAFNALAQRATPGLSAVLARPNLRVAALGGGPAAELLAAVVARDVAGGGFGKLAIYEWVDSWRPIVQQVGRLLGEHIEYHHCDVSKPLASEENAALRDADANFDVLIFSHVLLECGKGEAAPLELLRDLWVSKRESGLSHILVLDAGQARGRGKRTRPLAGSLRDVELLAAELGAEVHRVEGRCRTDGVLLARSSESEHLAI